MPSNLVNCQKTWVFMSPGFLTKENDTERLIKWQEQKNKKFLFCKLWSRNASSLSRLLIPRCVLEGVYSAHLTLSIPLLHSILMSRILPFCVYSRLALFLTLLLICYFPLAYSVSTWYVSLLCEKTSLIGCSRKRSWSRHETTLLFFHPFAWCIRPFFLPRSCSFFFFASNPEAEAPSSGNSPQFFSRNKFVKCNFPVGWQVI